MEVTTQLSVFLENRAGVLARLADDLARHHVSIRALTVANLVDHSVVRLIVSDPQGALHLFGERGVLAFSSDVLAVEVPDGGRSIADLARRLGRAGINIHDMSLSPSADNTRGEIAFWVPEAEATRAAEVVGA